MGGATSVMPFICCHSPSIGQYAVIGCKLQVPAYYCTYTHSTMLMRAATARLVQVL